MAKRYKVIRPKDHDAWLEERNKGLGSSEVGVILGVSKFDTPYKLWKRKKGYAPPVEENKLMRLGHILEQAVVDCFVDETGAEVVQNSSMDWIAVDKERDYLRVSPDRIYYAKGDKHTEANKRILECKTGRFPIDPDNIPKAYWAQVQYQMHVTGIHKATLAWLIGGYDFGYVDIEYSEQFCEGLMLPALDEFWHRNILGNEEPADVNCSDTEMRYPISNATCIEADDHIKDLYDMLRENKSQIKELTEQKDLIEDKLKMYMGENDTLTYINAIGEVVNLATWKSPKASVKFNEKKFAEDHPDLFNQYQETKLGSRRFNLK